MPYIKTRTTKAGRASTTLVESYRDDNGRPRQRILANLHGEPGTLEALVKLAFQREDRQRFRDEQWANLSAHDRDVNADWLAEYFAKLDAELAALDRELAVIDAHCEATPDQIQAAYRAYKKRLDDAIAATTGALLRAWEHQDGAKAAKAALRRLRR